MDPLQNSHARVSIIERVIPAISFGLASLSGIVAALMTSAMLIGLQGAEGSGMAAVIEGFDRILIVVLAVLGLSIAIGAAAIFNSLRRMSAYHPRASPPGFVYLLAGLPNLISPLLVAYSWSIGIDVLAGRYFGDPTETVTRAGEILLFSITAGIGSILILPIFAFVPFNARRGKKTTSIIALSFVVVSIAAVAIAFFGVANGLANIPPPRSH